MLLGQEGVLRMSPPKQPLMTLMPKMVAGLYCLGQKLGRGSFGEVRFAVNIETGEEVAVKLERVKSKNTQLLNEAEFLRRLQGMPGIANLYYADVDGPYNVLVMDLLGPSLEDLLKMRKTYSFKTVLMIADQVLCRIEQLHSTSLIHRDIKPANFCIGRGEKANVIYMIDFGMAQQYRDPKSGKHIAYCEDRSFNGTARYASINAHMGVEQSRRDDLESMGYMLIFLVCGHLPWQDVKGGDKDERYQKIMDVKSSTPVEELCGGRSPFLAILVKYCRALRFEDCPDYAYLRRVLRDSFVKHKLVNNSVFDWSQSGSSPSCGHVEPWIAAEEPADPLIASEEPADLAQKSRISDLGTDGSAERKVAGAGHAQGRFLAALFGCGIKSPKKA